MILNVSIILSYLIVLLFSGAAFSGETNVGQVSAISTSPVSARKAASAQESFQYYVENVKKCRPKLGFQGDCVGMPDSCNLQNDHQVYLGAKFFGNHYWLKALTSVNGEILKLSGEVRDPYPEGKLGVVEEGAYADLLLVDGNPLEDITVIGGNEQNGLRLNLGRSVKATIPCGSS